MTNHTEAERAEFEDFVKRRAFNPGYDLSKATWLDGKESYCCEYVGLMWEAWQAARRAPVVPLPHGGELSLLARIRKEIDHAFMNDHRMQPAFGRRIGDPCVRISNIEATIEGWEKSTAPQPLEKDNA